MSWTDERVTLLKKLWSDGRTAAEIARVLGSGFTRNAVIGKAHRLKLSSRLSPVSSVPKVKAANTQKMMRPRARVEQAAPVQINIKGVKMIDLKERMCRWPIGDPQDPDFKFCGCNAASGFPYCPDHARMAFQAGKRGRLLEPEEPAVDEADEDMIKAAVAS